MSKTYTILDFADDEFVRISYVNDNCVVISVIKFIDKLITRCASLEFNQKEFERSGKHLHWSINQTTQQLHFSIEKPIIGARWRYDIEIPEKAERFFFNTLEEEVEDYVNYLFDYDYNEDREQKYKERVFEAAVESIYGHTIWNTINKAFD